MKPSELAKQTIETVIGIGSATEGSNESWRDHERIYHLAKAASHLAQEIRIELGIDPRTEEHGRYALTRLAMALCIEKPLFRRVVCGKPVD